MRTLRVPGEARVRLPRRDGPRSLPPVQALLGPAGDRALRQPPRHLRGPRAAGRARRPVLEQQQGHPGAEAGRGGHILQGRLRDLRALRRRQEAEAPASDHPHGGRPLLPPHSAGVLCGQLLPRKDQHHVAAERAGGGRGPGGVYGADPERGLDLLHAGDAGSTAGARRRLRLPGGARQPPGTHQHPVGATVGLRPEQDVDGGRGAPAGPGLRGAWTGSLPEEQERNCRPSACSSAQLNSPGLVGIPSGKHSWPAKDSSFPAWRLQTLEGGKKTGGGQQRPIPPPPLTISSPGPHTPTPAACLRCWVWGRGEEGSWGRPRVLLLLLAFSCPVAVSALHRTRPASSSWVLFPGHLGRPASLRVNVTSRLRGEGGVAGVAVQMGGLRGF